MFLPSVFSVLALLDKWNSNRMSAKRNSGVESESTIKMSKSLVKILLTVLQQFIFKHPRG